MRENEKAEAFSAAIEILVERSVANADIKTSAGSYASTVRADLSSRMRPVARELFSEHGDLTGEELAVLLAAHDAPPTPAPTPAPPVPPTFTATDREPASDFDRARARAAIARIRQTLTTKGN